MIEKNKSLINWKIKKLGEIGKIVCGGTPSTTISESWNGDISWITPADLSNYKNKIILTGKKSISEFGLKNSSARLMPKGSVLFSSRAPIGYVVVAGKELCTNQGFKSIIPNDHILTDYLYYFLKSLKSKAEEVASGTTFKEISLKNFSELNIPLPPLPEQHRIVAKLEQLFSELDKANESFKKAKELLKTYRQSVLKYAFEGRFTNKKVKKGELPEGWKWVIFLDFCKLQRGYDLPLKNIIKGKYPVVTSSGIHGFHNEFRALGPCLITGRSGGVGNIHFFKVEKYWPHNTTLFVKDFCNNHPEFVYYYFLQFNFKGFSASTTIPTLDRKQFYNELVKVPPHKEQQLIVQEIEQRLSECDKMEETINQSLKQSETLRQSILKQAFEGKLVLQDPKDEPAEKLLERIKTEKEKILNDSNKIIEQKRVRK